MSRKSSNRGPGNRPARRASKPSRNLAAPTKRNSGAIAPTNLLLAAMNAASSAIIDLTFDLPVVVGDPAVPGATDVDFVSGNGGSTRHGINTTQTRSNFVSVGLSGNITRNKNYTATVAAAQGLIQPANGVWGNRSKAFTTPA